MQRIAVYPGSFDPPTLGHLDIIERAADQVDEVIVALGANSTKNPYFTAEQRIEALRTSTTHLKNVRVDSFEGLLVEYVLKQKAQIITRGLRAISDFDYEFQVAM